MINNERHSCLLRCETAQCVEEQYAVYGVTAGAGAVGEQAVVSDAAAAAPAGPHSPAGHAAGLLPGSDRWAMLLDRGLVSTEGVLLVVFLTCWYLHGRYVA